MSSNERKVRLIQTSNDLANLQKEFPEAKVLGITASGGIYQLSGVQISRLELTEAADYFEISIEEAQKMISDPNNFEFKKDEEIKVPELTELVDQPIEETVLKTVPEPTELEILKARNEFLENQISYLKKKNDKLETDLSKVIETLSNLVDEIAD